jgi:hypothetical protein
LGVSEGAPAFRDVDDDTLLELYQEAHDRGDEVADAGEERCAMIAAELGWRGIVVKPCGEAHVD